MNVTFEPEYIVYGLVLLLIGVLPTLLKYRHVKRQGLPEKKNIADFEVLEENLISGTPFDYGYTLGKNDRVIQVRSKQALDELIATIYRRVYYVKENPNEDFVLFGTRDNHKEEIEYWKIEEINMEIKAHLKRSYIYLVLAALFLSTTYFFKVESDSNYMAILINMFIITWIAPLLALLVYRRYLKRQSKLQ